MMKFTPMQCKVDFRISGHPAGYQHLVAGCLCWTDINLQDCVSRHCCTTLCVPRLPARVVLEMALVTMIFNFDGVPPFVQVGAVKWLLLDIFHTSCCQKTQLQVLEDINERK
jgi:hypothetical protein